ncbi:precorrin-3B C(17)-methyltransferase [Thiohalocapsa halophila]|uniref:precorrin-3B C(17)-methyltransferase n=1 Tax=Thiohalocapsa halophila TaxID=69359 RepID=UPI001903151F|nr:precorrin-3B C(17)-methyltransferase [Thiohalocapsa halophila]
MSETDPDVGSLAVVGLGPGSAAQRTPAVSAVLAAATDVLGYQTYLDLAGPFAAHQRVHASDNREELDRARHAFALAAAGARVAMVSSGDPGVFAMAAAVLEVLDQADDPAWHGVQLRILPGVSAAQGAAALAGAPLGHDFCALSLSDNLKPWAEIERRLALVCEADLVLALYNPRSKARPDQFARALAVIRAQRAAATIVVLGRDVGRPREQLTVTTLAELQPEQVDMRTLVIVGSSRTRRIERADGGCWVYTPRFY